MIHYTAKAPFVEAVRVWQPRLHAIPTDRPPCGFLSGEADGENAILARVFRLVCTRRTLSERQSELLNAIAAHEYWLDMAVDSFRGRRDHLTAPYRAEDRELAVRSRPYRVMIGAMKSWAAELHEATMAEVNGSFAETAATTRVPA